MVTANKHTRNKYAVTWLPSLRSEWRVLQHLYQPNDGNPSKGERRRGKTEGKGVHVYVCRGTPVVEVVHHDTTSGGVEGPNSRISKYFFGVGFDFRC